MILVKNVVLVLRKSKQAQRQGLVSCDLNGWAWIVRPESNLPRNHFTTQNRSLEQKQMFVLFIVFDNFFKVTLVYLYLLLWNTNVIVRNSIKDSITYPKHSQIHFRTDDKKIQIPRCSKAKLNEKHLTIKSSGITILLLLMLLSYISSLIHSIYATFVAQ